MTSYLSLIKQSLSANKMLDMTKVRIEEHLIPSYSVEMMCKVFIQMEVGLGHGVDAKNQGDLAPDEREET